MNNLYQELQLINEFEANFNPTNQSKKRKLEILGKLKTNLSANKTNELLKEYNNELNEKKIENNSSRLQHIQSAQNKELIQKMEKQF